MIAAVVLGAWAGGDRTAFGQTLLAHPLVAAALAGALAGVPAEGLWFGLALTLLSIDDIPVGERRLRDWTSPAIACPFACGPGVEPAIWGLSLVIAPLLAWSAGGLIGLVRRTALWRWRRLLPEVGSGDVARLEREHVLLTMLHFLRGALAVAVLVFLMSALLGAAGAGLGASERRLLDGLWRVAPLLGLPVLCRLYLGLGRSRWLFAGALVGLAAVALGARPWGGP